jgi:magnesium chelatase accessory protein
MQWRLWRSGRGPTVLLLHGTGSSGASWHRVGRLLATDFDLIAPDLPGQGGTDSLQGTQQGVAGIALALRTLLNDLGAEPLAIVGHSAGAAIGAQLALDFYRRATIISLNGALRPLPAWVSAAFGPLSRVLAAQSIVPRWLANVAATDPRTVRRLLDTTGSRIDEAMEETYRSLLRKPEHIAGTLTMFAHWDLRPLAARLPALGARLALLVGTADTTVRTDQADWVQRHVPACSRIDLPGLGHLAQEEAPEPVAAHVRQLLKTPPTPTSAASSEGDAS